VKIKIAGAALTGIFFVMVAYLLSNMNLGIPNLAVSLVPRLVEVFGVGIYAINSALSEVLWRYRGIDIVVQAMFLFVAALAVSVLFYEPTGKGEHE
jgi:multisubunit Na+/H+ antiporter MnhB subunit